MKQIVYFEDLGEMDYQSAWDYQEQLMKANLDIKTQNRLLQLTEPADELLNEQERQNTSNHLLPLCHWTDPSCVKNIYEPLILRKGKD